MANATSEFPRMAPKVGTRVRSFVGDVRKGEEAQDSQAIRYTYRMT
jgi:hypothetical protein